MSAYKCIKYKMLCIAPAIASPIVNEINIWAMRNELSEMSSTPCDAGESIKCSGDAFSIKQPENAK